MNLYPRSLNELSTNTMYNVFGSAVDASRHHRPQSTSYLECIKSVWYLHDETINIWTYLVATLVFLAVSVRLWDGKEGKRSNQSRALHLFLPAATLFFLSSTLYHVFQNHVYDTIWHTLDHCSIVLLTWASSRSFSILAFSHRQAIWRAHRAVSTAMALLSFLLTVSGDYAWKHPTWAPFIIHALHGSIAAIPALNRPSRLHWRSSKARRRLLESFQTFVMFSTFGCIAYTTRLVDWMMDANTHASSLSHCVMHMAVVVGTCVYGREIVLDDYA
jgi:adiponectin receptor